MRPLKPVACQGQRPASLWFGLIVFCHAGVSIGASQTAKLTISRTNSPLVTLKADDSSVTPQGGYLRGFSHQDLLAVSYSANEWGGGFSSTVGFDKVNRDDSKIIIRDRRGEERSLRSLGETAAAYHGNASLLKSFGFWQLQAGGRSSLGRDLFFTKQYSAGATGSSLTYGLRLGILHKKTESNRPSTTFIDRDFRTKYRPAKIITDTTVASAEQIIGEKNKVRVEFTATGATAERPAHLGALLGTATAIQDTLFLKTEVSATREQRNRSLRNERGYFSTESGSIGFALEPWYDILLEAEGTYQQENEVDPRVNETRSLIAKSVGIGAAIKRFQPNIDIGALATELETKEILLSMEGAVSWNF